MRKETYRTEHLADGTVIIIPVAAPPAMFHAWDGNDHFEVAPNKRKSHVIAGRKKRVAQEPVESLGGLFGDDRYQTDLIDMIRKEH